MPGLQVVWDDSTTRLFVVPTGTRPLGLLFRANKGQVDFEGVTGDRGQITNSHSLMSVVWVWLMKSSLNGC